MAITWEVTITPIDVPTKTASVTAVRTDDVAGTTETHSIISVVLATGAQKLAALDNIWQQHLDYTSKRVLIEAFIGSLEADAKTNLEAREV